MICESIEVVIDSFESYCKCFVDQMIWKKVGIGLGSFCVENENCRAGRQVGTA
jgi:hypothetical protein